MVNAREAARRAIESTYEGMCSIVEYGDILDEQTKITSQGEVTILEGQPCRLSFETISAANQTDTVANVSQKTKLFLPPEVTVTSGSKIIVTQNGITTEYSASGEPAVYFSHQEIMLELFRGWT